MWEKYRHNNISPLYFEHRVEFKQCHPKHRNNSGFQVFEDRYRHWKGIQLKKNCPCIALPRSNHREWPRKHRAVSIKQQSKRAIMETIKNCEYYLTKAYFRIKYEKQWCKTNSMKLFSTSTQLWWRINKLAHKIYCFHSSWLTLIEKALKYEIKIIPEKRLKRDRDTLDRDSNIL